MPRKSGVTGRTLDRRSLEIAKRLHDLARATSGQDVTFEHQQDLAAAVAAAALAELWTDDPEPATGPEVGVHNGPTIKPIELRVGIIEHMTPNMARVVGELSADQSSRGVTKTLCATGLVPPSRAFLAKRTTSMSIEIADQVQDLEQAARDTESLPTAVASVSTGLDRMSVRMSELADPEMSSVSSRPEPYERTPPPPKEHHYRKAWVGSTSVYDAAGNELHTWQYAVVYVHA